MPSEFHESNLYKSSHFKVFMRCIVAIVMVKVVLVFVVRYETVKSVHFSENKTHFVILLYQDLIFICKLLEY